jgi:2-oxoisovalerate dehydrogenase E1 component beta subunit
VRTMPELTYLEAIRTAMHDEMEIDDRVFVMGEDVGRQGGAFGATKELQQRFGELRSIDTPVAESGIVGVAVGAAMAGQRPIAEMQFADFVSCAFDQLITCAAKMHYRIGWAVPMVVRCPNGGGVGGGPYHSENVEAWFHHHAGLKIVCPATATDAYGLLRSAIRDPNPVVFCEHKFLYRRVKEEVVTGARDGLLVPLGEASVLREGADLSIITYASTVQLALAVADTMEAEDVSVEVIDLRSLVPFDRETVLASVRKTGKALIVHEDNLTGGFGGEVAAVIAEEAFEQLDAPVRRVAALDTPIPFSPPLEREYLPLEDDILAAARDLAAY